MMTGVKSIYHAEYISWKLRIQIQTTYKVLSFFSPKVRNCRNYFLYRDIFYFSNFTGIFKIVSVTQKFFNKRD